LPQGAEATRRQGRERLYLALRSLAAATFLRDISSALLFLSA